MAWIPMRTDLARDPTVLRLMDAFDLDAYSIVGRLHALWSWVDEQTLDGNADVTPARCDVMVSVPGFTEVLQQEKWVTIHNDRVEFLNWARWNLQTTKARLLASRRVVTHRKRKRVTQALTTATVTEQNSSSNARDPSTGHSGTSTATAAADGGEGTDQEKRSACLDALERHGLKTAAYLLDEFPHATPGLIRTAMEGVSARAQPGARVKQFRERMPQVIRSVQGHAERQRKTVEQKATEDQAEAEEAERERKRWQEIDRIITRLSDEDLAQWKRKAIRAEPVDLVAASYRGQDPRRHDPLKAAIARLIEQQTQEAENDPDRRQAG